MDEQQPPYSQQQPPYEAPPAYQQPPYQQAPPPYAQPPAQGLSTNAAAALAYVTIIPAILFLVIEPYNRIPFVKFHAFQNIGLVVCMIVLSFFNIIPILGQIVFLLGLITLFVVWLICIINASQGKIFKIPVIGKFAAEQSGLMV